MLGFVPQPNLRNTKVDEIVKSHFSDWILTARFARDAKIAEKKIKQVLCVLSVGGENEYQNCSLLGGVFDLVP